MADFSQYGIPSKEWTVIQSTLPPSSDHISLADLKEGTNRGREDVARREMVQLASKVILNDYLIPARDGFKLEARSYRAVSVSPDEALPIYVHFHGGGFCFGTLSSDDAICSRLAINTNVVVLNINYRHTPEFGYPTAWNDSEDALDWAHGNADEIGGDCERIIIGGISAGSWLTASLSLANLRRENNMKVKVVGQVLMIPALVFHECYAPQLRLLKDPSCSSYVQNRSAPILPLQRIKQFNHLLKVEQADPRDLRLNPGYATSAEVRQLPPTIFGIAGLDPLRDEALFYAKLLADNDVPIQISMFKGVPHGFRRFSDRLPVTKDWDRVMEEGILWALSSPTASKGFEIKTY
ncbi:hypothetical protein LTR84_004459 [Exophiala bonariae]|uniref:Alpha/beta hydrolase fold-3 domain-containing protein n=1 Tax=Exophiala bonariae TaxID=1690606 RepID=A0AAV9N4N2_9EURO|nr:hypothetical protein LTR84_004459 [Exophiala bonariae]